MGLTLGSGRKKEELQRAIEKSLGVIDMLIPFTVVIVSSLANYKFYSILSYIYLFIRAAHVAYGSSQARGRIGATVTITAGSEPCLQPTPQPTAKP